MLLPLLCICYLPVYYVPLSLSPVTFKCKQTNCQNQHYHNYSQYSVCLKKIIFNAHPNRKRCESKPTLPQREFSKRTNTMTPRPHKVLSTKTCPSFKITSHSYHVQLLYPSFQQHNPTPLIVVFPKMMYAK